MPTTTQSLRWILVVDAGEAIQLLQHASQDAGFEATTPGPRQITVRAPRSLWKRRPAIELTATLNPCPYGTEVLWSVPGAAGAGLSHLTSIEHSLPGGSLHDHGIADALADAGIQLPASTTARHFANVLYADETVHALGTGHLKETPGILALTNRRIVFLPHEKSENGLLTGAYHAAIQAISLGKKTTGETLAIQLGHTTHLITHMGHGEGHRIARTFRDMKRPKGH